MSAPGWLPIFLSGSPVGRVPGKDTYFWLGHYCQVLHTGLAVWS